MEIVGKSHLQRFQRDYPQSRKPLDLWVKTIESGYWKHFTQLKETFGSVDYVSGFVVFDIKGNDYRLITIVVFQEQQVFIKHVFTHHEYDKWSRQLIKAKRKIK